MGLDILKFLNEFYVIEFVISVNFEHTVVYFNWQACVMLIS
jgi:hypothetical protein